LSKKSLKKILLILATLLIGPSNSGNSTYKGQERRGCFRGAEFPVVSEFGGADKSVCSTIICGESSQAASAIAPAAPLAAFGFAGSASHEGPRSFRAAVLAARPSATLRAPERKSPNVSVRSCHWEADQDQKC